jgi:hypothetical protein
MRSLLLILASGFAVLAAHAQPPVAAPQPAAGDRWVYDRYGFTDRPSDRVEVAVDKIDSSAGYGETLTVLEALGPDSRPKGEQRQQQRAIATLTVPTANVISGSFSLIDFPVEVGRTWQYEMTFTATSGFDLILRGTAKVVGWEEVQVPAGKFRALKVEHDSNLRGARGPFTANRKILVWYVPEVKRWVRYDFTQTSNRADSQNRFRFELVSFQLK